MTNRRNNHISDHLEYVTIIVRVWASQVMLVVKNPPAKAEDKRHGFDPCVRKIPWRRAWQPTPVFLPGESYGQRTLAGYRPWGHKESDTTKATEHTCTWLLSCRVVLFCSSEDNTEPTCPILHPPFPCHVSQRLVFLHDSSRISCPLASGQIQLKCVPSRR